MIQALPRLQPYYASLVSTRIAFAGLSNQERAAHDVFDPNTVRYHPDKVYSPNGQLTWGQKLCTFLIKDIYQDILCEREYTPEGELKDCDKSVCLFKRADKLSCSEYTLVAIHQLGVWRGILAGVKRILRCNCVNQLFLHDYQDPVFPRPGAA